MQALNIFVLMGQSNMSGRGDLSEVPILRHPDVFMWRDGQWMTARENGDVLGYLLIISGAEWGQAPARSFMSSRLSMTVKTSFRRLAPVGA